MLTVLGLILLSFLKIDTEAKNQYSLSEIMAIANLSGKRLDIIDRNELSARAEVEAYRSDAWPIIQFSSGLSYVNQSIIGQGTAATEISRIIKRIDGYSVDWTLSLEQPLLTFGRTLNTLKLARFRDKAIGFSKRLQRDTYFLEVVQQFITAFTAQYDYTIYSESVKQSIRTYERVHIDFQAGLISHRDLLFMEAAMRSDKANLIKSRYKMEAEKKQLAVLIGLDSDIDSLYLGQKDDNLFRVSETRNNKRKSLELKLKELEVQQNEYQKRYTRATFFPSLNLTGSIQNNFIIIDTSGLTGKYIEYLESTGTPLPDSTISPLGENPFISSYFDPDYFSYSIGLRLNWNIFDGKRKIEKYRQLKYTIESSRLELEQMTKEFHNDISDIRGKIIALDSMITSLELQFQASEMALEQAETDLKNGFINVIDYVNTMEKNKSALRQLEGVRLEYLVTKIQLRIAMGLSVYEK
jgi:outer membrane protein TolC